MLLKRKRLSKGEASVTDSFPWENVRSDGVVLGTGTNYASTVRKYKYTQGYDVEDFQKKLKAGELLPFTPFRQYTVEAEHTGSYNHTNIPTSGGKTIRFTHPDGIGGWIIPHLDHVTTEVEMGNFLLTVPLDTRVFIQEAATRIAKSFDALTFVAELSKTIALFKQLVRRIISLILSGSFDKLWLEYRYGWRLLYFDIIEILNLVNNLDQKREIYSERVGGSYQKVVQDSVLLDQYTLDITYNRTTVWEVSGRGSVVARISPPKVQLDPVLTAWEIVPLSFIIDWVVDIGRFLETLRFFTLSEEHSAAGGYFVTADRTVIEGSHTITTGSYAGSWYGHSLASLTVREPSPVASFPIFNVDLDGFKILDLLALLLQTFRR